jgi:hypothetical protein
VGVLYGAAISRRRPARRRSAARAVVTELGAIVTGKNPPYPFVTVCIRLGTV